MKKEDIISHISSANKRNSGKTCVVGFSIKNYHDVNGEEKAYDEKILYVGYDDNELCAIGTELVYPLGELTKRELEGLYKSMQKRNGNKDGSK